MVREVATLHCSCSNKGHDDPDGWITVFGVGSLGLEEENVFMGLAQQLLHQVQGRNHPLGWKKERNQLLLWERNQDNAFYGLNVFGSELKA